MLVRLLNERHLIDFSQSCHSRAHAGETRFAEELHSLFLRRALDFRAWPAINDHLADAVREVEQFADGGSSVKSAAGAFQAAGSLIQSNIGPFLRVQAGLQQHLEGKLNLFFAVGANHAHKALREDAVQSGNKVIWLDAHVDETANHVRNVVGVDSCEYQMARERRLNRDLRRLLIANFADHDFVGVVSQNRPQAASKRQSLLFVHRNLSDAADLIFDGIFDGDDFVFVGLDFIDGGVKRGRLARARRACDQHHSVRLANVASEFTHIVLGETHYVAVQSAELLTERFLVQHAKHSVFAVNRRHDRNAKINKAAFVTHAEAAILRNAPLG